MANVAFSLGESPSSFFAALVVVLFARDRGLAVDVVFVVVDVVSDAAVASSLGRSRLLSRAVMVGVHVVTEETALRTASAWECIVSMKLS